MAREQKLRIDEYLSTGCPYCAEALEQAMKTYTDAKGRKRQALYLERNERLVIVPDYNSAGILTGFHVNVQKAGERLYAVGYAGAT